MTGAVDPEHFFHSFPRFVETSETGHHIERLDARYLALIHANRELLADALVLDVACHDGRFGFAALHAGARHVVGMDLKGHLIGAAAQNMEAYGIAPDRYRFLVGDMFDCMDRVGPVDVAFCFGILYHIVDHMRLLQSLAEREPRAIIIDTKVSDHEGAVVEIRSPLGASPPEPGSDVEAYPTRLALESMVSSFGWTWHYHDWVGSGLTDRPNTGDYRSGGRITMVVRCPEHGTDPAVRQDAVERVISADHPRETEYVAIAMVAKRFGLPPQALRRWVHQEERARQIERDFLPG